MLSVLIVQPWIRNGGAELISVQLAYELERRGHRVGLACTFISPAGLPNEAKKLQYHLPARWLSILCQRSRLMFLLLAPWVLLSLTWKHSRDVDVLNPHNFPALWVAALIGTVRRIPIVWTCNEPPERPASRDIFKIGPENYLGWLIASSWIDKVSVGRVECIYVPSDKTRQQVQQRYGRDATVIRLGIDKFYFEQGPRNGWRDKLNLNDSYVLLCVGKLHPQKNQGICIEAMGLILPQIPNAVLVLVGDGPMANAWRAQCRRRGIERQVRFIGHRQPIEVRELYAACDLNLFPPKNQSWGLTPFEALAAGTISIVSSDSGASEILSAEGIGIVCEPTAEAFARCVLKMHRDRDRLRRIGMKGRRYVKRHLTWERYSTEVIGLFQIALGKRRRLFQGAPAGRE